MVKIDIPPTLYEDFCKEKENLESTLSTMEVLKDKELLKKIEKGLSEIKQGKSTSIKFDEIDNL